MKTFQLKNGRLRFYSGTPNGGPFFLEVPFRGVVTAPVDRPRPVQTLKLDRGRLTPDAHYVQGPDDVILAPLPFACNFMLQNTEPNFSKFLTMIRQAANTGVAAPTKTIGSRVWASTKGTSTLRQGTADGAAQALITTPAFIDLQMWCVDAEMLWEDPDNTNDRGYQWKELYFPPDRQITEGEEDVIVDLSGDIYGAIAPITAFTAGTES